MDDDDLVIQQISNDMKAAATPATLTDNKSTHTLGECAKQAPDGRSLSNDPEDQNDIRDTNDCEALNRISFPGADPALVTDSTQLALRKRLSDELDQDETPSKRLKSTQPNNGVHQEYESLSNRSGISGGKLKMPAKNINRRQRRSPDTDLNVAESETYEDGQSKDIPRTTTTKAARQPQSATVTAIKRASQSTETRKDKTMPTRVNSRVTRSQSHKFPLTPKVQNNKPNEGIKMSKLAKPQSASIRKQRLATTDEHPHKHNPDNEKAEMTEEDSEQEISATETDAGEEDEGSSLQSEPQNSDDGVPRIKIDSSESIEAGHRASQNSKSDSRISETRTLSSHLELFGQEYEFNSLLSSAKSVGLSNRNGEETQRVPALSTVVGKELSNAIREARRFYKSLSTIGQSRSDNLQGSVKAQTFLNNIREQIDNLVEEDVSEPDRGLVIQDLLAHVNPHLVLLLKYALQSRTDDYASPRDVVHLQEIVFLMDTIHCLCVKAQDWKAKPRTDAPITAVTTRKICPSIRQLKKVFLQKLNQRKRVVQRRENNLLYSQSQPAREESPHREHEERYRRREKRKARIYEDACRNAIDLFGKIRKLVIRTNDPVANVKLYTETRATEQWTEEQDKELIIQLQNKESRGLPCRCFDVASRSWLY